MRGRILFRPALFVVVLVAFACAEQFVFIKGDGEWSSATKTKFPQLGPAPGFNMKTPVNYVTPRGTFYMKYSCKSKPTTKTVNVQMCLWKPGETCSGGVNVTECNRDYYWKNLRMTWCGPAYGGCPTWEQKFSTIRMVHRAEKQSGGWLGCGGSHCYKGDASQYIPVKFFTEVIMVSADSKLQCPEDWNCPDGWGAQSGGSTFAGMALKQQMRINAKGPITAAYSQSRGVIEIASLVNISGAIKILNSRGQVMHAMPVTGTNGKIAWDGITASGKAIAEGFYAISLEYNGMQHTGRMLILP